MSPPVVRPDPAGSRRPVAARRGPVRRIVRRRIARRRGVGRPVVLAVLLAGALTACTDAAVPAAPGPPERSTPAAPSPGPASSSPGPTSPGVTAPRDGSRFTGCAALTPRLAPDLVAARSAVPAGAGCTWTDPAGTALLRADVGVDGGLGALYRASDAFRAFRAGTLAGAPTVVTTPEGDPSCSLHAGVSDEQVLTVQVGPATAPVRNPCARAAAVASRLLNAMPRARR